MQSRVTCICNNIRYGRGQPGFRTNPDQGCQMPFTPPGLSRRRSPMAIVLAVLALSGAMVGQQAHAAAADPGPRGGPAGAGGALPGLGTAELKFFKAALAQ